MKTIQPKIHDINQGAQQWSNAHAVLGRAMERTQPGSRILVAWYDEETREIKYMQTCGDLDVHYMCHRIAGAI